MDYSRFDPEERKELQKTALRLQHQYNSAWAILLNEDLPIAEKVQALAGIQKEMIKDHQETINRLWANDDPHKPEPWTYEIHSMMKELFTMQMGKQPSWDVESGSDEEYEPNPRYAGYIGAILALYEQTYPEYS